jgi:phenylalanyl-tRNA synthetase beta chain
VPVEVAAADYVRVVREAGGDMVESARLFDVYQGPPLPSGTKSLAVEMSFRVSDRTLTLEEVGERFDQIVEALGRNFGAVLRE